jgi:redox-sensitive bicupin YhaK (pirin superfamily)
MTAGRGIVHCEMPGKNSGEGHGLQLWVNLSKKYKMVEPNYQELLDKDIPRTATPDGSVQVKIMYVISLNIKSE